MTDENTTSQNTETPRRQAEGETGKCPCCETQDKLVECSECVKRMCPECINECADCGASLCDDCTYYCEQCDDTLCDECSRWCNGCDYRYCDDCTRCCEQCDADFCTACMEEAHSHEDTQIPCYRHPYRGNRKAIDTFTFGLEIEIGADHDHEMMSSHPLIAGWCPDGSLHKPGALEYQTQPMTMQDLDALTRLIAGIDPEDEDDTQAGGHMHISRAPGQTPARWYWALHALNKEQAENLNMRHLTDARWCRLERGEYRGKTTAINNDHANTIEFRTFGPWWSQTADKLTPAVTYMHTMWRFFQHHPLYHLKRTDIMATSVTAYRHAITAIAPVAIRKEA